MAGICHMVHSLGSLQTNVFMSFHWIHCFKHYIKNNVINGIYAGNYTITTSILIMLTIVSVLAIHAKNTISYSEVGIVEKVWA